MMKKLISFILTLLLTAEMLTSCSILTGSAETMEIPAHVEGAIFGGKSDDCIAVTAAFDMDWITKSDNTVYNPDLAAFAALLCADSYFREKDLEKGTQNRVATDEGEYSCTSLLTALGFSDAKHVESYKEKTYATDANDSVTMNLAYADASGKYDVFVVAVRGCFSAGEWMSVFDPGADSSLYEAITGEHPEWTDKNVLKGIDIAANRAMELIDEFIAEHDDPVKKNCVLITGHSRGAAIAEVIGARFEDDPDVKSCAYAFNSSAVTTDRSAQDYKSIFNIFDSGDLFTEVLPFEQETWYRYGRVLTADVSGSDEIRDSIRTLKGRDDYSSAGTALIDEYQKLFKARFQTRESLYEARKMTETFADEGSAKARYEVLSAAVSRENGLGLEGVCTVQNVRKTDNGEFVVSVDFCDAAVLFAVSKIFTYGGSAEVAVRSIFGSDPAVSAIVDFILTNGAGISSGHLLANSYVLCRYVK